jgi:hypothetical protein
MFETYLSEVAVKDKEFGGILSLPSVRMRYSKLAHLAALGCKLPVTFSLGLGVRSYSPERDGLW